MAGSFFAVAVAALFFLSLVPPSTARMVATAQNTVALGFPTQNRVQLHLSTHSGYGASMLEILGPRNPGQFGAVVDCTQSVLVVGDTANDEIFVYTSFFPPMEPKCAILPQRPRSVRGLFGISLSISGNSLAVVDAAFNETIIYSVTTCQPLRSYREPLGGPILEAAFSQSGALLLLRMDTQVILSDALFSKTTRIEVLGSNDEPRASLTSLAPGPDDTKFVVGFGYGEPSTAAQSGKLRPMYAECNAASLQCTRALTSIVDPFACAAAYVDGVLVTAVRKNWFVNLTLQSGLTKTSKCVRMPQRDADPRLDPPHICAFNDVVAFSMSSGDPAPEYAGKTVHCKYGEWSPWSGCSAYCGAGVLTRSRSIVQQPRYFGDPCTHPTFETTACEWYARDWAWRDECTPCNARPCSTGTQQREVYCKSCRGDELVDAMCSHSPKPGPIVLACDSYTYSWIESPSQPCQQTSCGQGTRRFLVQCQRCDGAIVGDGKCFINNKPAIVRGCLEDDPVLFEPLTRQASPWSVSDAQCQGWSTCYGWRSRYTWCQDCRGRTMPDSQCPPFTGQLQQTCPCSIGPGAGCVGSSTSCADRNPCPAECKYGCSNAEGDYYSNPYTCSAPPPPPPPPPLAPPRKKKKCLASETRVTLENGTVTTLRNLTVGSFVHDGPASITDIVYIEHFEPDNDEGYKLTFRAATPNQICATFSLVLSHNHLLLDPSSSNPDIGIPAYRAWIGMAANVSAPCYSGSATLVAVSPVAAPFTAVFTRSGKLVADHVLVSCHSELDGGYLLRGILTALYDAGFALDGNGWIERSYSYFFGFSFGKHIVKYLGIAGFAAVLFFIVPVFAVVIVAQTLRFVSHFCAAKTISTHLVVALLVLIVGVTPLVVEAHTIEPGHVHEYHARTTIHSVGERGDSQLQGENLEYTLSDCLRHADRTTCAFSITRYWVEGVREEVPIKVPNNQLPGTIWLAQNFYGAVIDVHMPLSWPEETTQSILLQLSRMTPAHNTIHSAPTPTGPARRYATKFYKDPVMSEAQWYDSRVDGRTGVIDEQRHLKHVMVAGKNLSVETRIVHTERSKPVPRSDCVTGWPPVIDLSANDSIVALGPSLFLSLPAHDTVTVTVHAVRSAGAPIVLRTYTGSVHHVNTHFFATLSVSVGSPAGLTALRLHVSHGNASCTASESRIRVGTALQQRRPKNYQRLTFEDLIRTAHAPKEDLQFSFNTKSEDVAYSYLMSEFRVPDCGQVRHKSRYPTADNDHIPCPLRLPMFLSASKSKQLRERAARELLWPRQCEREGADPGSEPTIHRRGAALFAMMQHPHGQELLLSCINRAGCCLTKDVLFISLAKVVHPSKETISAAIRLSQSVSLKDFGLVNVTTEQYTWGLIAALIERSELQEDVKKRTWPKFKEIPTRKNFVALENIDDLADWLGRTYEYKIGSTYSAEKMFGGKNLGLHFYLRLQNEASIRYSLAGQFSAQLILDNTARLDFMLLGKTCNIALAEGKFRRSAGLNVLGKLIGTCAPGEEARPKTIVPDSTPNIITPLEQLVGALQQPLTPRSSHQKFGFLAKPNEICADVTGCNFFACLEEGTLHLSEPQECKQKLDGRCFFPEQTLLESLQAICQSQKRLANLAENALRDEQTRLLDRIPHAPQWMASLMTIEEAIGLCEVSYDPSELSDGVITVGFEKITSAAFPFPKRRIPTNFVQRHTEEYMTILRDSENHRLAVSYRGTSPVAGDVATDLHVNDPSIVFPFQVQELHKGFVDRFTYLLKNMTREVNAAATEWGIVEVIFLGHSLGGAVATIAAYYARDHFSASYPKVSVSCITFGSAPLARDGSEFAKYYPLMVPRTARFLTNDVTCRSGCSDPVTDLVGAASTMFVHFPLVHVAPAIFVPVDYGDSSKFDLVFPLHFLSTYLHYATNPFDFTTAIALVNQHLASWMRTEGICNNPNSFKLPTSSVPTSAAYNTIWAKTLRGCPTYNVDKSATTVHVDADYQLAAKEPITHTVPGIPADATVLRSESGSLIVTVMHAATSDDVIQAVRSAGSRVLSAVACGPTCLCKIFKGGEPISMPTITAQGVWTDAAKFLSCFTRFGECRRGCTDAAAVCLANLRACYTGIPEVDPNAFKNLKQISLTDYAKDSFRLLIPIALSQKSGCANVARCASRMDGEDCLREAAGCTGLKDIVSSATTGLIMSFLRGIFGSASDSNELWRSCFVDHEERMANGADGVASFMQAQQCMQQKVFETVAPVCDYIDPNLLLNTGMKALLKAYLGLVGTADAMLDLIQRPQRCECVALASTAVGSVQNDYILLKLMGNTIYQHTFSGDYNSGPRDEGIGGCLPRIPSIPTMPALPGFYLTVSAGAEFLFEVGTVKQLQFHAPTSTAATNHEVTVTFFYGPSVVVGLKLWVRVEGGVSIVIASASIYAQLDFAFRGIDASIGPLTTITLNPKRLLPIKSEFNIVANIALGGSQCVLDIGVCVRFLFWSKCWNIATVVFFNYAPKYYRYALLTVAEKTTPPTIIMGGQIAIDTAETGFVQPAKRAFDVVLPTRAVTCRWNVPKDRSPCPIEQYRVYLQASGWPRSIPEQPIVTSLKEHQFTIPADVPAGASVRCVVEYIAKCSTGIEWSLPALLDDATPEG